MQLSKLFRREYLALILFGITFESVVVILSKSADLSKFATPTWLAILVPLIGLASFRGGRAVSFNYIFEWLRAPFTIIVDDSSGAGKNTEATGTGFVRVIGELLCCPICSSTWVALVLVSLLLLDFPIGLVMCLVLAGAGLAEIFNWHSEKNEWQGRQAREIAGSYWLVKNSPIELLPPETIAKLETYSKLGLQIPKVEEE